MTVTLIESDLDPYALAFGEAYINDMIYWPGFGGGIMSGTGRGDLAKWTTAQYGTQSRFVWDISDDGGGGAAAADGIMMDLRSYGGQIRDLVFVGSSLNLILGGGQPLTNPPNGGANYASASVGILMQKETVISGSGGAGKMLIHNVGFAGLQTGIQMGNTTYTEAQSDICTFSNCEFNRCDIAVHSTTQNSLDHLFESPIFRLTPIGFKIDAGGNWHISNPLILGQGFVLMDFTGAGSPALGLGVRNANYTITNFKADATSLDPQILLMNASHPCTINVLGGVIGNELMTTPAFTCFDGCTLNITGFHQLQNNHIVFSNTGAYHPPIFNLTGCVMAETVLDAIDIFDLSASTGYAYVNMIGCSKIEDAVDPAAPDDYAYSNRMVKLTGLL